MVIAQELAADAQDHRPVASDQGGEGGLGGGGIAAGDEPLDELAIGEPRDRAAVEERLELPGYRCRRRVRHGRDPPPETSILIPPLAGIAPLPAALSEILLEKSWG